MLFRDILTDLAWAEFKELLTQKKALMQWYDIKNTYFLVGIDGAFQFGCSIAKNGSADQIDFETNYKVNSDLTEAAKVRLTTCKIGRHYHDRFFTFTTAKLGSLENLDYLEQDFGDITYKLIDDNGDETQNNSQAVQTWLDFMPAYSYEVLGGSLYVPTIASLFADLWEVHCVGAPDIPAENGGSIIFIANSKLKWLANKTLVLDSSLNPAELTYSQYGTNKIRFIFKHPQGVQLELQFNLKFFR